MKPRIFKIDPHNIDLELMKQAVSVIHNRGIVAFPTETVYGLGANALDAKAVAEIFRVKERPLDDPLIVHIAEVNELYRLAKEVPFKAEKLINRFWPGSLTLIFEKTDLIPDLVTAGLETVAIRMPLGAIARKFISMAGVPIAAPSANLFGRPSPTRAQHVLDDLNSRIDIIIDGGRTEIGVESTVVEFADEEVVVLRPGAVTVEELREIVKDVKIFSESESSEKSPGKYLKHYSPRAEVILVEHVNQFQIEEVLSIVADLTKKGRKVGIMAKQEHEEQYKGFIVKVLGPEQDDRTSASRLFHILREFDSENTDVIVAEGIPETGLGRAIMNRLRKAAIN